SQWHDPNGRVRGGVGPFSPARCSDALLEGCADLSQRYEAPLHMHLEETRLQSRHAVRQYGHSAVDHLSSLGVLSDRFSGAHGVWLDDHDIAELAERSASVVHNPVSNMMLGSGIAPVAAM